MDSVKFQKLNFINLIKKILSPLTNIKKKGDNGIVGVIGGSFEYTGAPYYAGISALYTGSDLTHVFCHTDASIPIKCYSPELIVHPAFDKKNNKALLDKTVRWFKSMDSLIVGCGLGRDEDIGEIYSYLLNESFSLKSIFH
jgi:ATP-dependent NAD(P)H-hydrate dehydratase